MHQISQRVVTACLKAVVFSVVPAPRQECTRAHTRENACGGASRTSSLDVGTPHATPITRTERVPLDERGGARSTGLACHVANWLLPSLFPHSAETWEGGAMGSLFTVIPKVWGPNKFHKGIVLRFLFITVSFLDVFPLLINKFNWKILVFVILCAYMYHGQFPLCVLFRSYGQCRHISTCFMALTSFLLLPHFSKHVASGVAVLRL